MNSEMKFRLLSEQKALIERAAQRSANRRGTGNVSDWVRAVLIEAARQELGEDES